MPVQSLIYRGSADIDVDAVHQGIPADSFARASGRLVGRAPVMTIERIGADWIVLDRGRSVFAAPIVVDAAGRVGRRRGANWAGVRRLDLQPIAVRTAILVDAPDGVDARRWPNDARPRRALLLSSRTRGLVLISPADEDAAEPCRATRSPTSTTFAVAVDHFENATGRRVARGPQALGPALPHLRGGSLAGPSGFDPDAAGFFWLAGQGG